MNKTREPDNKETLEQMVDVLGWSFVIRTLQDIAFEKNLADLYRELDNIGTNYIPEVN